MQCFVKTIALFSVLTFAGCQSVRDSAGFYTIESRNKDVSERQQTQEKKKITALDANTVSIKDAKRQETDAAGVDKSKYINEPVNGGMEDKEMITKKMEEAVRAANNEPKSNRFVTEARSYNTERTKECNCKCENNKSVNKQENVLTKSNTQQDGKTLYIQVGVFSSLDYANALADRMRSNSISNVKLIDDGGVVKVVVGGFANKVSGQKTINKLYDMGIYDYFWKEIR